MALQPNHRLERTRALLTLVITVLCIPGLSGEPVLTADRTEQTTSGGGSADRHSSPELIAEGQRIFRFDTFGDEQLWTDTLRLHEMVEKSVDPTTALSAGRSCRIPEIALRPEDARDGLRRARQDASNRSVSFLTTA